MAQRKDVMLEWGQCLALKGSVALPLVKVGGYGQENISSKYVPSYLIVKKGKCGTDIASRRRLNEFVCPAEVTQKAKLIFLCVLLVHRHESKCLGLGAVSGCNPLLKVAPLCGLNISFNLKLSCSCMGLYAFSLVLWLAIPVKNCVQRWQNNTNSEAHVYEQPCLDTAKPLPQLSHHSLPHCTSHGLWASLVIWAGKLIQKKNKHFFPLCGSLWSRISSLIQVTVQAPKVWSGSSEEMAERKEEWQETARYR